MYYTFRCNFDSPTLFAYFQYIAFSAHANTSACKGVLMDVIIILSSVTQAFSAVNVKLKTLILNELLMHMKQHLS